MGIQSSKVFVIQWIHHVAIQESDKSSRLTGRTLGVTKKHFDPIHNVSHPHEMIFVEPTHIFFDEMIGNCNDRLAFFELWSLPGVSKVTISIVSLFSLASKIHAKLFRHVLGGNVRGVDGCIMEVEHAQILCLFGSSINLDPTTRLLLPLTAGGIVLVRIRCRSVALASITLIRSGSGVGNGTRCTICKGVPFILPWSVGLGVLPRTDGVGSNRPRCLMVPYCWWVSSASDEGNAWQLTMKVRQCTLNICVSTIAVHLHHLPKT